MAKGALRYTGRQARKRVLERRTRGEVVGPSPSEHALTVAKRVVNGGADRQKVGRLYTEYSDYLRRGVQGSFSQLLYVRCLIDRETFDRLQILIPPPPLPPSNAPVASAKSGWGSGVVAMSSRTSESDLIRVPADLSLTFAESVEIPRDAESTATLRFQAIIPPGESESSEFQPLGLMKFDESMDELSITGSSVEWEELKLPPRQPAPADWIGDYELLERIGRGAMGVIFLARKRGSTEKVALKALLPKTGPAGEKARQRFDREVLALERLKHPNLVRVLDSGTSGPIQWYCMDYVQGRTLKDLIAEGKLDIDRKLRLFLDVCDAISHAHGEGVIHRDLKPGNIILDDTGRAVVLDLGLAKITGKEQLTLTCTSSPIGTPYYMAPEQLIDPKSVGQRTDVFALGALLHVLTTGQRPFEGETFLEISQMILHEDPPSPTSVRADLPSGLDAICARAMQKDIQDRYPEVAYLRGAVTDLLRGMEKAKEPSTQSAPPGSPTQEADAPPARSKTSSRRPVSRRTTPARKKGGRFLLGFLVGLIVGIGSADFIPLRFQSILPWWKERLGIEDPVPLSDSDPGDNR